MRCHEQKNKYIFLKCIHNHSCTHKYTNLLNLIRSLRIINVQYLLCNEEKRKKKERKEIKERKERKKTSLSLFTSHKNRNRPQHTYIRQGFIIPNLLQKNYLTRTSFGYCNMYFVFFIVNERCTTIIYYLNLKNCTSGLSIWNSYMAS